MTHLDLRLLVLGGVAFDPKIAIRRCSSHELESRRLLGH